MIMKIVGRADQEHGYWCEVQDDRDNVLFTTRYHTNHEGPKQSATQWIDEHRGYVFGSNTTGLDSLQEISKKNCVNLFGSQEMMVGCLQRMASAMEKISDQISKDRQEIEACAFRILEVALKIGISMKEIAHFTTQCALAPTAEEMENSYKQRQKKSARKPKNPIPKKKARTKI
jgi:hypothetical protein